MARDLVGPVLAVRLPVEVVEVLSVLAERAGVSRAEFVRGVLVGFVDGSGELGVVGESDG